MTAAEEWLAAVWPVVRARLPPPPAHVVELGCGPLGGLVPMLRARGYQVVGVDPDAPSEAGYLRAEFERVTELGSADAVVASASLHHVSEPRAVIERIARILTPAGTAVVVEWDWEAFDERTAEWCFDRLRSGDEPGWLHRLRDGWLASGEPWQAFLRAWAQEEGLHAWTTLLRLLDERFARAHLAHGPYVFPDLRDTDEAEERAAIDAGEIRAMRVDYAGTPA